MTLNHQPNLPEPQPASDFPIAQASLPSSNLSVVQPSVVQTSMVQTSSEPTAATPATGATASNPQEEDLSYHKFSFNKQDPQTTPTVTPLTFASICVLVGGAVLISNPHIFKPRPIFAASADNTAEAIEVSQLRNAINSSQQPTFQLASTASSSPIVGEQTARETNLESQAVAQDTTPEPIPKKEPPLTQFEVGLIQAARWTPPANVATQIIPPAPVPVYSYYPERVTQPQVTQPQITQPQPQPQPQVQQPQPSANQSSPQNPQAAKALRAEQRALAAKEQQIQEQLAQREALFRQQQEQAQLRQQAFLQAQQQQAQKAREDEIRQQQALQRLEQAERAAAQRAAEQRAAAARQQALAARPTPAPAPAFSPGSGSLTGLGFTVGARPTEGFTVGAFQRGTATDSCLAPTAKLTPLAPPAPGKTLAPVDFTQASDSLTFFVHVPATDATTAQFTFGEANSDKQLHTQVVSITPNQAEVIGIQVPHAVTAELEKQQKYLWQFALRCNESNGSNDPIARGVVVKQPASPDVPQSHTARAAYYAEKGLWPDAVSVVAQLYQQAPNDTVQLNNLRSLFRTAGLPSFVNQAPITIY